MHCMAIRLCHYDTILDMKKNKWAIYFTYLHKQTEYSTKVAKAYANRYQILQKSFNDDRIKDRLKESLPGLLAQMVLTYGMEASSGKKHKHKHNPSSPNAPYAAYKHAADIDTDTLCKPSDHFKDWQNNMEQLYETQGRMKALHRDYELHSPPPIYGNVHASSLVPTYLSAYYLCCDIFNPYSVFQGAAGVKLNILKHSADEIAIGKYSVYSLILNKLDPAKNSAFDGLVKKCYEAWKNTCEDITVEHQHMKSILSFKDSNLDECLKVTNIDSLGLYK